MAQVPASTPVAVADPRDPIGTAVIAGTVVDDGTGKPMAGVRVTRWIWTDGAFQHESITDAQGRFIFHDVGAGAFHVIAEFAGYTAGQNGMRTRDDVPRPVVVTNNQRLTNVALKLFPSAAAHVRGTVTDNSGAPAAGVTVVMLRRNPGVSQALLYDYPTWAVTDDRGQYDVGMVASDFVVVVPPARTLTVPAAFAQPDPRQNMAVDARPAVFVPDTPPIVDGPLRIFLGDPARPGIAPRVRAGSRSWAYGVVTAPTTSGDPIKPLHVDAGTTQVVDIAMKLEPAGSVTGRLVGPNGPLAHAPVRLMPEFADQLASGGDTGFDMAQAVTDQAGQFRFTAVPAGRYIVRSLIGSDWPMPEASTTAISLGRAAPLAMTTSVYSSGGGPLVGPILWADLPLSTNGSDVAGVELVIGRGAGARGHVVFESTSPPKPADLPKFSVGLLRADGSMRRTASSRLDPDANFEAGEYPTGRYEFSVNSTFNSPWIVKSIVRRGRDLFSSPFELGPDGLDDVVVTMTDVVSSIRGVVHTQSGAVADQGAVAVFPVRPEFARGRGAPAQLFKMIAIGADGQFDIGQLLAGEYSVVAVGTGLSSTWSNPETVSALARVATRVTVGEKQAATTNLSIQTVRVR
jgi:protocatechuate 3,4-dioxygenase beta subunit